MTQLTVREIQQQDIEPITDYWLGADVAFMEGMGVDMTKLPVREFWKDMLQSQLDTPIEQKQSYATIWEMDGKAIGHCNVNKIVFGKEAYMHLHIWDGSIRQKGYGMQFVKMSLPYFFNDLKLETVYCEPYALNPSPNKTLEKIGFELEKEYITTPGSLSFEQPVKRWKLSKSAFEAITGDFV
ncbi:MAG: GNAT family N-acetyltransferase [Chitinophagaceae bacterium]|nr:GNAT family N-acetyltransferase [Chitinophagaceae bacterium]